MRCEYCKSADCEICEAHEPYSEKHWICPKCDSTYPFTEKIEYMKTASESV